jgi:signal transduction histidine kinase
MPSGVLATAVRLYVDDHGPRIPAAEQALFEPYVNVPRSGVERTGSGLGLAVVRGSTALDGRAVADAPGGGTRAVIELRHAEQVTAASSTVGMA